MQWHDFVRFILQAQESVVTTWLLAILFPLESRVYATSQDELCHRKIRGIKSMKPKTSCHGIRKSMSQHDQELPTTQVGKKVNVTTYIRKILSLHYLVLLRNDTRAKKNTQMRYQSISKVFMLELWEYQHVYDVFELVQEFICI